MIAREYLELSAETVLMIEESHVDQYIEDMCKELKSLGLYRPEHEFASPYRLEQILEEYHDRE